MDFRRASLALALLALGAGAAPAAAAAAADPDGPISEQEAIEIAEADPNAREAAREHPDLHPSASRADGDRDWEVGFFSEGDQVVQVVVDDTSGEVEESWTGHQVAWKMARGYDGAFGRTLNAPYVWLPLCAIFLVGLFDWRRPFRIAHLDLLAIVAGFGLSHYFFNQGEIGLSVPLAYPPLLYLLGRMLWLAFRGGEGLRPRYPMVVFAIALVFLVGARIGLNVGDSNVIDVGYSGVIGADKIADGEPIYGEFPSDNTHGDTYGPLAYYAYVPFEQIFTWSGDWDELPAAHAAAIFFDLGTIALLILLGRNLRPGRRGTELGVILAFAWAACPYTTFALESNTNDSLVAMLLVGALLVLTSAPARGAVLALATATKFAPIFLVPLFATYDTALARVARRGAPSEDDYVARRMGGTAVTGPARRVLSVIGVYGAAFAVTTLGVLATTILDPGISEFWDRSVGNQAGRDSPFSVWGQEPGLGWLHTAVKAAVAALAVLVAFIPRRRDVITVAALGAAVVIAVQLLVEHWFYLYIPWFLPFALVALLARAPSTGGRGARERRADAGSG